MQKYKNNVQDTFGNAVSGVTVTIRDNPGGGLSTIFSDNGVTGKSNPFTNDSDGEFFFYAADGRYDIELSGPVTETKDDIRLLDIASSGTSLRVKTDIVTATPPTTEAVNGSFQIWDLDETDQLARLGYLGSNSFGIVNLMHGGPVLIAGEDAAGTQRTLVTGDPDNTTSIHYGGTMRARTAASGVLEIASDGSADNEVRGVRLIHQDGTIRGRLEFLSGSSIIALRNEVHGSALFLEGEDAGGTIRELILMDPDNDVSIYSNGNQRWTITTGGIVELRSDGNTDAETRLIRLQHSDGTNRSSIGHKSAGADFYITQLIHGAKVLLAAEDAGGTERTILDADPDATTIIRGDTVIRVEAGVGSRALQGDAGGATGLYYNNQQNLRTSDEAAADIGMGAEVRHITDDFYPVGMNTLGEVNDLDSGNVTLSQNQAGLMLTYNTGTARTLQFNNNGNIPLGAMWSLLVGPSAGTLTGDGGAGMVIRYWNGSGWTDTAAAGNITIGVGQYTIWKETDILYWISGPTLS